MRPEYLLIRSLPCAHVVPKGALGGLGAAVLSTLVEPRLSQALESDEFPETFEDQAIGIELEDVRLCQDERRDVRACFARP